jgi:RNA polymerase-binding transcription factor DksA
MADDADLANDYNEQLVSRALGKIRQDLNVKSGPKNCAECEDKIPTARRKLGFKLCVQCAEEAERRDSLYAGH